ncbi:3-phosphoshikimate 1-carboxyvinyltransferase [Paenibacillus lautus]|uniref:3-phosphoshikimate 1-carboxyvinyltransferase n=1 Tax=Paenibacillus lautus TaxID=1401 RepID=UPI003D2AFB6D
MDLNIEKINKFAEPFNVTLKLPGSKSITLRDFILASLAVGVSEIELPGECDDTFRMEEALRKMGIGISRNETGEKLFIKGNGGSFSEDDIELDIGMSGTSTRLLLALSILRKSRTTLDGHESLRARPNKYLIDALKRLGADIESRNDGYLPVHVRSGKEYVEEISLKGDRSSQYFSALLQIAPILPNGLVIHVEGELVSKPYIDITINEMRKFGVNVENNDYKCFVVKNQSYKPTCLRVEGDASAASYFFAIATLHGGTVVFDNIGNSSFQGDYKFHELCTRLGANIICEGNRTIIKGPKDGRVSELIGSIDMESMPDVAPTLMAMAPFIPGVTRITGLSTLRIKECDRISAPVTELRKLGVKVVEGSDFVEIEALPENYEINKQIYIDTYDDHRMAMSFAVVGTKLGNVVINDAKCVEKTYPRFWEDLLKFY